MILLRRILLAILLLLIVFVSIAFLLPRKINIRHSVSISSQRVIVFDQLSKLSNWPNWFQLKTVSGLEKTGSKKWTILQDGMVADYSNLSFHISRSYSYDSLFVDVTSLKGIDLQALILVFDTISGCTVNCTLQFDLGTNPINRWFGGKIRQSAEKSLRQAMQNLNNYASGLPVSKIKVGQSSLKAFNALVIRDTSTIEMLDKKLATMYKKLSASLLRQKLKPTGPPFLIYYSIQSKSLDIEAGIPINSTAKSDKMVDYKEFSHQNIIKASVFGKQDKTLVYNALEYYAKGNKINISGPVWEMYLTDPAAVPDSNNWQTEIFYPISFNSPIK